MRTARIIVETAKDEEILASGDYAIVRDKWKHVAASPPAGAIRIHFHATGLPAKTLKVKQVEKKEKK